jgi:CheY-like chemotaxis protein
MCQGHGHDGSGCVLVVDDDRDIRESVSEVLADEGYVVEQAANGEEALTKLADKNRPPCLVFLDMMMPVMTGGEVLAALADDGDRLKNLPVVVVSAHANLAETTGARLVMQKPVTLEAILAVADRYCEGRGAPVTGAT